MFRNYLKITVANLRRYVSYSLINVSGLALGLACALIIFSLVTYHLGFDNFHYDSDRIYRFVTEQHSDDINYTGSVPPAFGHAFREDYAFGEKVARVCTLDEVLIAVGEGEQAAKFSEQVAFVEPDYFEIFNFPLITGSAQNLSEPNTVLVTERIGRKYFGNESPMGKVIRFNNKIDFTITGVVKDIPENTDLSSEIFFTYSSIKIYSEWYGEDDAWGGITSSIQTFVRLQPGVTPEQVEEVLPAYVKKYRAESKNVHHYHLQPLSDMHFNPNYGGRIPHILLWVLSLIALLLVLTACLNFISLATAQAINRSKEVGVRKTMGSTQRQLFWQFTAETAVIVILATAFALAVVFAALPFVNELFGTQIRLHLLSDPKMMLFVVSLVGVVTILAGAYPAAVLSRFKPALALKGKMSERSKGSYGLRRILTTIQFTISQVLALGLIVVVYQISYLNDADLGFDQDAVVMIPLGSDDNRMQTLADEFRNTPGVQDASLCFAAPASENRWGTMITFDNRNETENFSASFRGADDHYLSTFNIGLVAGRNLTHSDTVREFLVNETLVRKLGFSSPQDVLGKPMIFNGDLTGSVVGVIEDFHDQSLRSAISPVFISTYTQAYNAFAVKIDMRDAKTTLASLEKLWSETYPDQVYDHEFLDQQTASFYKVEQTMLKLIEVFSFIAIFIAFMGLYGMVSFMAVQKTKEIGIRKVLGSTVAQILVLFGREFAQLVVIAFLIAAPIGWMLMSKWLQLYAYHIDMNVWIFALELAGILLIVVGTVGYESAKAAWVNPVKSLRAE